MLVKKSLVMLASIVLSANTFAQAATIDFIVDDAKSATLLALTQMLQ